MSFPLSFLPTRFSRFISRAIILLAGVGLSSISSFGADESGTGPNLLPGTFETGQASFNPWGGVDDSNGLHVWVGKQLTVNNTGSIDKYDFSPSVAVGDLNGDGLPDLVIADARGYFWFYPNSGTPKAPAFTHGEVMPVWVGGEWVQQTWIVDDTIPRIQLIDYDGDGRLDLVIGNCYGELFFVHNGGTPTQPVFRTAADRSSITIPTHSSDLLWCNYLTPFLYDWIGNGHLDLTMGDGTYSANSIYLFANQGGNIRPVYNERHRTKIIPGMGREHLTPQVIDWNNDGKPDIIAGERTGSVNVYLNQAANKGDAPVFDKDNPIHVQFGSAENVGPFPTVCAADLNGDHLFDLIVPSADGRISYSLNTGTLGAPKFGPLIPLKGVYPFQKTTLPTNWQLDRFRPYGLPYGYLECVNAKTDAGFIPPPGTKLNGAAKFSMIDIHPVYFKDMYQPEAADEINNLNTIDYINDNHNEIFLTVGAHYILSMWVRSDGSVSNITWETQGQQITKDGRSTAKTFGTPFDPTAEWTQVHIPLTIPSQGGPRDEQTNVEFFIFWKGAGTLYLDDITLKKAAP